MIGRPSDIFVVRLLRNEGGIFKAIVKVVAQDRKSRGLILQEEAKPHNQRRGEEADRP